MPNERGANSNKDSTLADDTALELNSGASNVDNYPSDSLDTTGSGGYGGTADSFSDRSQRGLVDKSLDPGQFGRSNTTTSKLNTQAADHHDPLNPYGESGPGTPDNGEWQLAPDNDASRVADRRNEQWGSKDRSGDDIGA